MIRIDAQRPAHFCDGLTRRDFLHAGSLAMLGLSLPQWYALRAQGAVAAEKDVNCILLFLVGGPSHIDTFDPKPEAGRDYCGDLSKPIPTNVDEIMIGEPCSSVSRRRGPGPNA